MKKALGLAIMITTLTVGSMTAYAAPVYRGDGTTAVCTHNADCQIHEDCQNNGSCTYEDCPYDGNHCSQYTYNGSGYRHHSSGHGHGRGHC